MATVTFSIFFDDSLFTTRNISGYLAHNNSSTVTSWNWFSGTTGSNLNSQFFAGTGITYNGSNAPTGGTISDVALDLGSNGFNDITISGLSLDANLFAPLVTGGLSSEAANNVYWRTILSGNDTIDFGPNPNSASINFYGDGRSVETGLTLTGGDDTIIGNARGLVAGDFYTVLLGSTIYGGADNISVTSANQVSGDVISSGGYLQGGNDTLSASFTSPTGALFLEVYGDASAASGTVIGGDDIIIVQGAKYAVGDVGSLVAGVLHGGIDTITGSSTNGTILIGDTLEIRNGGEVFGGNDIINGGSGNETLIGDSRLINAGGKLTGGNDTIHGGNGNDVIYGDWFQNNGTSVGGSDRLFGDAGNDTIYGNGGNDTIDGGAGNDTLYGDDGFDELFGGEGDDLLYVDGQDTIDGGIGSDFVTAFYSITALTIYTSFANVEGVYGSSLNDTINAGSQTVRGDFYGYNGDDVIAGSAFADYIHGGNGNDTLYVDGFDTIEGGAGSDFATAYYSGSALTIYTSFVNIEGVYGSAFNDTINAGSQTVGGTFYGYDGDDTIAGSAFNDYIHGGNGNDMLYVDGTDTIVGGDGIDFANAYYSGSAVNLDTGALTIEGVYGSAFNDTINASGQTIGGSFYGYDGNDIITSSSYADYIHGGNGYDYAAYSGNSSDYLRLFQNGVWYVGQISTGIVDELISIESLRFLNGDVVL